MRYHRCCMPGCDVTTGVPQAQVTVDPYAHQSTFHCRCAARRPRRRYAVGAPCCRGGRGHLGAVQAVAEGRHARKDLQDRLVEGRHDLGARVPQQHALRGSALAVRPADSLIIDITSSAARSTRLLQRHLLQGQACRCKTLPGLSTCHADRLLPMPKGSDL
jgi:hypothetical protein